MSRDFTETRKRSKLVYSGRMLKVHEDEVFLPDGKTARREYIFHPGAALILPVFEDSSILLERQYRYAVSQHCYELPAGKLEPDEPSLETAKRELLEETGYVAAQWTAVFTMMPCIGYSNEHIECFLARDLSFRGCSLDEGEFLETLRLPVSEALEWVRNGTIRDSKTMLGILWLDRMLNAGW
ncbi:MAG: NUDIX domain-containing protein [Burkholderiales bacterium]|nr:NUDIX domain-containing protein [Burkholderiales bacterium]